MTIARPTSTIVWTSESPEMATHAESLGRYAHGACNRGLPLNADGVSCSGDCHPEADFDEVATYEAETYCSEHDVFECWFAHAPAGAKVTPEAREEVFAEIRRLAEVATRGVTLPPVGDDPRAVFGDPDFDIDAEYDAGRLVWDEHDMLVDAS